MRVSPSRAAVAAISLALAATVVLAPAAVAAPPKGTKAAAAKGEKSKGAGHTKLPPGKGGKTPGHGGTPPGQALKDSGTTRLGHPKSPSGKGSGTSGGSSAGSQGTSSDGGTHPSSGAGTVRGPLRTSAPVAGQGRSLPGSPWRGSFNASDRAPRGLPPAVDAFIAATRDMAFPIVLALLVLLFVFLQGYVDRRDPKLAVAPIRQNEILSFE